MAMISRKLRLINRNQMGFTLIELVVAIAISGVITGAITTTIFQVIEGSARTNNHMTVVRQVQSAGYWVTHDAQMAQVVGVAPAPDADGFPLTLTWTEWNGTVNVVTYTFNGTELQRDCNGELTSVAQFINLDPGKTNCYLYKCLICDEKFASMDELEEHFANVHPSEELEGNYEGGVLTFTVTATMGAGSQEQSETRTYEIVPRPGS